MRRMHDGGVAFNRDSSSGKCQYAQCHANAGCRSAFFFENQRLTSTPTAAPASTPLVPALARKPRRRQTAKGRATSISHSPIFHWSSSRRGMNGLACIASSSGSSRFVMSAHASEHGHGGAHNRAAHDQAHGRENAHADEVHGGAEVT